ncbi:MAG TPA: dephospho-CoA kinase [Chloroflexota bacterium]
MTPESWPTRPDVYLIGITGNIATGKSTVDAMLAAKGAQVLDADRVVHELQRQGQPAWRAIVDHFGRGILAADGELDRAKLGQLVFGNADALRELELLIHPAVRDEERRRILEAMPGAVLAIDAIKLFESGMADSCNSVWAVTAPVEQQLDRLRGQRSMPAEVALQRIRAQPSQEEKAALAGVVIDNGGSLEHTQRQVDDAWKKTAAEWLEQRQATA